MSQLDAVRGGDEVVRELLHLDQQVKEARRVLVLDGETRPRLLAELNARIEPLGLKCVAVEEVVLPRACAAACSLKTPCRSFSDIELAPLDRVAQSEPLTHLAPVAPVAPVVEVAQLIAPLIQEPAQDSQPSEKLDMSKPINWKLGDIFSENPRFTLLHKRREWELLGFDVADSKTLKGVDIEIQTVGAGDNTQELMTIQQFMSGYVFVRRPQSAA